jgi:membrane dipeptidase
MSTPTAETRIQQALDIALDILKPTQQQLDHGLELHRESIVIETYGLGFRAPLDPDALTTAIDAGASPLELQDLSEDMRMTRWAQDPALRAEYRLAWAASGVTCILQNAGEEGNAPERLIKRLARYTYLSDTMDDLLLRASKPQDIAAAKEQGLHCFYMSCNGVPLPGDQITVEEELRYICVFFQLGCRMMHLTYNRRNALGDGCAEPANAGLSDFGRAAIAEMNRTGIIVDLAHSGQKTSLEAAQASQKPVVASHSGAWELTPHCRCKNDDVIRAIADSGGLIGITNIPAFLGKSGDINALLDHIDYIADRFGVDYLAIGTDNPYTSAAAFDQKLPAGRPTRTRWEALWPEGDPLFSPEWKQEHQVQSMAWTNWPLFTVGLVQRGYVDEEIRKIIGGNFLRVAQEVWPD